MQEFVSKRISNSVFYGGLVDILRRIDSMYCISWGSKIVKRFWRRHYDPVMIEKTIVLVLGPSSALYRLFIKHCTLTHNSVDTIWPVLPKPPKSSQGPGRRPLLLLVGSPLVIRLELILRWMEQNLTILANINSKSIYRQGNRYIVLWPQILCTKIYLHMQ